MRFVLLAALKDVRRRLADPAAMAIWIGIPLVLSGLLSFIANTGGDAPRALVLLVDQDNTVITANHDIARFDVSMHNPLLMGII